MTAKIEQFAENQTGKSNLKNLIWVSPLAILTASVANLGLYALAGSLFPEVTAWAGAGVGQIVGATIVYLLIGTLVFAVVAKLSARPARNYLIVATVGLLLSLALPIGAVFGMGTPPGTPPAEGITAVILSLMHVVTYAISVPLFIRLVLK